jgi:hypothetical protein
MAPTELLGLLECPFQKGFVEFTYRPGDCVSELRALIDKGWRLPGRYTSLHMLHLEGQPWAFFCQDKSGAYVRLMDRDPLPTGALEADQEDLPELPDSSLNPISDGMPIVDMRYIHQIDHPPPFKREEYQELSDTRFKLRFTFDRSYEISEESKYSIRLIVLVAIVGG